jgi:hypothetical protein
VNEVIGAERLDHFDFHFESAAAEFQILRAHAKQQLSTRERLRWTRQRHLGLVD